MFYIHDTTNRIYLLQKNSSEVYIKQTHGSFQFFSSPHLHAFGLWDEPGAPGVNPHRPSCPLQPHLSVFRSLVQRWSVIHMTPHSSGIVRSSCLPARPWRVSACPRGRCCHHGLIRHSTSKLLLLFTRNEIRRPGAPGTHRCIRTDLFVLIWFKYSSNLLMPGRVRLPPDVTYILGRDPKSEPPGHKNGH